MDDLADKVIAANERNERAERTDDSAPEGYYTDDLGFWVEVDIRKNPSRFAEYIFTRCRRRNQHLYYDAENMVLFNRHDVITPSQRDILELANLPDTISTGQAIWVYNKLKETVPRLDRNRIVIAPGLAWDIEKGEIVELTDKYYTVGGENEQ